MGGGGGGGGGVIVLGIVVGFFSCSIEKKTVFSWFADQLFRIETRFNRLRLKRLIPLEHDLILVMNQKREREKIQPCVHQYMGEKYDLTKILSL